MGKKKAKPDSLDNDSEWMNIQGSESSTSPPYRKPIGLFVETKSDKIIMAVYCMILRQYFVTL